MAMMTRRISEDAHFKRKRISKRTHFKGNAFQRKRAKETRKGNASQKQAHCKPLRALKSHARCRLTCASADSKSAQELRSPSPPSGPASTIARDCRTRAP